MKTVELYYDFSSPNAYFAALLLPEIAARHGAAIEWRPILLGGLFKALGAPMTPGMTSSEKSAWGLVDLQRWGRRHGIPFRFASRFPLNTTKPLRIALLSSEHGLDPAAYAHAVFRAYWADDRDISDPAVLSEIVTGLGGDAVALLSRIEQPAIKEALRTATESARARGVFGVPTYFVGDELHFGKDRLDFVEEALAR